MKQKPTITAVDSHYSSDSYRIDHPAYGIVKLGRIQGGDKEMFGSDLRHGTRVRLTVHQAHEERHLNNSNFDSDGALIDLEFTESQWARFVSSHGLGAGTPCTLLRYVHREDGKYHPVVEIEGQDNLKKKAGREFAARIRGTQEKGAKALSAIDELLVKGKAGKGDLLELRATIEQSLARFSSDAEYATDMFQEQVEELVESGKLELEAHINQTATRLGMAHISKTVNLLEDK